MISVLPISLVLMQTIPSPPPPAPPPLHLKEAVRDFPRSQLQLKVSGPISIELNQATRASYEILADLAGLNVIFDPDIQSGFFEPLRLENVDILEAFDRLSLVTGHFVEVLDNKTIMVARNNATERRDHELHVLKTIYLGKATSPQEITQIITALRTTIGMRYIAINTGVKAVIVRDTPDRVAAAERLVAELDTPRASEAIAIDPKGSLLIADGKTVRRLAPARSRLQVRVTAPISINMNEDARTSFETLAARAGLNVVFDRDFRSAGPIALKVENTDILNVLDFLSRETVTFWEVLDETTILVSPDNQTKRREYARTMVKTIYFENTATPVQIIEIITALRTLLNMRYVASVSAANAVVIKDTPVQIMLAEKIIADLSSARPAQTLAAPDRAIDVGTETGGVLRTRAVRSLQPAPSPLEFKTTGRISVDINENTRQAFERLAGMAGLRVTFDKRFQDGPPQRFTVRNVGIVDALDFLSLQTGTFWIALDGTTIMVAPDGQSVRGEFERPTEKVMSLTNIQTEEGLREIVAALRTVLNARQVESTAKSIVLRDTAENVAIAERIVADLDRRP